MSQHIINDGAFEYVFGWDQPLRSFYCQKHHLGLPKGETIVDWVGATPETTMYEVEDLVREAKKIGLHIDSVLQRRLYQEKDEGV